MNNIKQVTKKKEKLATDSHRCGSVAKKIKEANHERSGHPNPHL
jgi:hypothetical protein